MNMPLNLCPICNKGMMSYRAKYGKYYCDICGFSMPVKVSKQKPKRINPDNQKVE